MFVHFTFTEHPFILLWFAYVMIRVSVEHFTSLWVCLFFLLCGPLHRHHFKLTEFTAQSKMWPPKNPSDNRYLHVGVFSCENVRFYVIHILCITYLFLLFFLSLWLYSKMVLHLPSSWCMPTLFCCHCSFHMMLILTKHPCQHSAVTQ